VPEHALRVSAMPETMLETPTKTRSSKMGFLRRGRLAVAACAIAGAATLGACSPAQEGTGNHAVNIAWSYLGTPYVYGGARPGGFDCSGLTQYVYGQLHHYLPRTAEQQFEYVQKIPQSWKQKGDLIFFGTPGAIYHVGIYVGNNMIEHAPSPGNYVRIIPIWTSQYYVGRVP
jgi:cell wall-associated NlpC family hydrolase